jgi:maleylpyruvate isomerase
MILHGYWRSGTAFRTRIALNLKGLAYDQAGVDLRQGDQKSSAYLELNPQGLVPALEVDGLVLTQSPAILEWLEETTPEPPLLPADAVGRARVRAMAALVGCDIHPLNNLRVLKALRESFDAAPTQTDAWAARWITAGFAALETLVADHGDGWAYGSTPGLADCYLSPQIYSARRFHVALDAYPRLLAIESAAEAHPAFIAAHPDCQPDAD